MKLPLRFDGPIVRDAEGAEVCRFAFKNDVKSLDDACKLAGEYVAMKNGDFVKVVEGNGHSEVPKRRGNPAWVKGMKRK